MVDGLAEGHGHFLSGGELNRGVGWILLIASKVVRGGVLDRGTGLETVHAADCGPLGFSLDGVDIVCVDLLANPRLFVFFFFHSGKRDGKCLTVGSSRGCGEEE